VELRVVAWDDPDAIRMRREQETEVAARYADLPGEEPGPKPTAADSAVFVVAYDGDEAIGSGGLRALDATHGEIKRMYVVPARRGSGVSTALLRRLEDLARGFGWDRLVLETGIRQPDAMRLYEREGYVSVPAFGYYADDPYSRCYAKALAE
jgi:putative acetyltransferase